MEFLNSYLENTVVMPDTGPSFSIHMCSAQATNQLSRIKPKDLDPLVDVMTPHGLDNFITCVLHNLMDVCQMLIKKQWLTVLRFIHSAASEVLELDRIAKLSLALIVSRFDSEVLLDGTNYGKDCAVGVAMNAHALPPDVVMMLNSDDFQEAFRAHNYCADYPIPPTVIPVDLPNDDLRGWVCTGNFVAINRSRLNIKDECDIMDLATLIGHEARHGMVRADLNNSNAHTPEVFATSIDWVDKESGRTWERTVWAGVRPRWANPRDRAGAVELAIQLLQAVGSNGRMSLADDQERAQLLRTVVGTRDGTSNGMDYTPSHQMLID